MIMGTEERAVPRHPIRVVTSRTGLSPSVLRAWERRYGAVTPGRSEGGQRLYSDVDVRRLTLLARATAVGRAIGQLADFSDTQLEALVREDGAALVPDLVGSASVSGETARELLDAAVEAVTDMDGARLDKLLLRAAVVLNLDVLVDELMVPLLRSIGDLWAAGSLGPATERLASGIVRRFLEWLIEAVEAAPGSPVLVCATPTGHRHELGAILSGVVGAGTGWRPVLLGPDLPAREIAYAVLRLDADAVALSAIHPAVDPGLSGEIRRLVGMLPRDVDVLVGGPAALAHRGELDAQGAVVLQTLGQLRERLTNGALAQDRESGEPDGPDERGRTLDLGPPVSPTTPRSESRWRGRPATDRTSGAPDTASG